jgi:uncharacterized delta-60 repeat protein
MLVSWIFTGLAARTSSKAKPNDRVSGWRWLAPLIIAGAALASAADASTIAIFANRAVVGAEPSGNCAWEPEQVGAVLSSVGTVVYFTELDAASVVSRLQAGQIVVIPDQENAAITSYWGTATSSVRSALQAGGRMLVFGDHYLNDVTLLNSMISGSPSAPLADGGTSGTTFSKSPSAPQQFATSAPTLDWENGTYSVANWPAGGRIYSSASGTLQAMAYTQIGSGLLGFVAYDFYCPSGANATAWSDATKAMARMLDARWGSVDQSFGIASRADSTVTALAAQPDGKTLVGGYFTTINGVARNHIARLNPDGSLDTTFDPGTGANSWVYALAVQSDGKILVGGEFTSINGVSRNYIARLNSDGSVDTGFNGGTGANSYIYALAVQPDGKVLAGGSFTAMNGVVRSSIARLNSDGSLDTSFTAAVAASSYVWSMALQSDGKVLVGGSFTTVGGVSRNRIARLNSNGSLDTSFNPGTGANDWVRALALQSDGKVLVGGDFTTMNGTSRNRIARLNSNGTIDTSFNPGTGADGTVWSLSLRSDGTVLAGGDFTTVNGVARSGIGRLNSGGGIDTAFDPGTGADGSVLAILPLSDGRALIAGAFTAINGVAQDRIARLNADGSLSGGVSGEVFALGLQPDGKVLVGGNFTAINGVPRSGIARLNSDGSLDLAFDPGAGANGPVLALARQPDGKVLLAGSFGAVNGVVRSGIARLNADGSVDTEFDPGTAANGPVSAIVLQPDGKVLVGGGFSSMNGVSRNSIARLNADGTLDVGFDPGAGPDAGVFALALQPDGKVIVGGEFGVIGDALRNGLARLNSNGSLDTTFSVGLGNLSYCQALALQPDGKVLVGGSILPLGGVDYTGLVRLNPGGSIDTAFAGMGASDAVSALALQPDGKVLLGGWFTAINGVPRNRIARLNASGSLDTSFDPGTGANNPVLALVLQPDGKVLIGGSFTAVNGVFCPRIARLTNEPTDTDGDGTPDTMDACPNDASRTIQLTFYRDLDSDGYGLASSMQLACSQPAGYVANSDDCNDSSAAVNPAATEICDAGNADENCNGLADNADIGAADAGKTNFYRDQDADGYSTSTASRFCDLPSGYEAAPEGDCADTNADVYPGAIENCANLGVNNDCDGANDAAEAIDSAAYYVDGDTDGYGAGAATMSCTAITGRVTNATDCNDSNGAVHPGASESCNGIDDDCAGGVDNGLTFTDYYNDADHDGVGGGSPTSSCAQPTGTSTVGGDQCDNDPLKQAPGVCGCGTADTDANGNGISDCADVYLSLTPSATSLTAGGSLRVRVSSSSSLHPLGGVQLAMHFDQARLRLESVAPVVGGPFPIELAEQINNTAGTLRYAIGVDESVAGMTSAANLCDLTFTVLPGSSLCGSSVLVTFGDVGPFSTRVARMTGGVQVPLVSNLSPINLDSVAPVISGVPSSVSLACDAGSIYGAYVAAPAVSATDDCDGGVAVSGPTWPSDGMFPIGATTLTWTATDSAGNIASESCTITVANHQLLDLSVGFVGVMQGTSSRQVRVTVGGQASLHTVNLTGNSGSVLGVQVPVAASHPCISVKCPTHSLTDAVSPTVSGVRYAATASLPQGDCNDDDMVEIFDYAIFVSQRGTGKATNAVANYNADTTIGSADFTYITLSFFSVGESCAGALNGAQPRDRVSVKDLRRAGYGNLTVADLNRDGWVDMRDIQAYMQGAGMPSPTAESGMDPRRGW